MLPISLIILSFCQQSIPIAIYWMLKLSNFFSKFEILFSKISILSFTPKMNLEFNQFLIQFYLDKTVISLPAHCKIHCIFPSGMFLLTNNLFFLTLKQGKFVFLIFVYIKAKLLHLFYFKPIFVGNNLTNQILIQNL